MIDIVRGEWSPVDSAFHHREEFRTRMFIARRAVEAGVGLTILRGVEQRPDLELQRIRLEEFSKWALSLGWSIPQPLASRSVSTDRSNSEGSLSGGDLGRADRVDGCIYWQRLRAKAELAIEKFPQWKKSQRKVQRTANLVEWLKVETGADTREAEIIKKVLAEIFSELR